MTIQAKNIKDTFTQLSKSEQLELMHYFLQVVSSEKKKDGDGFMLSDEWKSELDKRDAAYHSGDSKTYSLEDTLKQFGV